MSKLYILLIGALLCASSLQAQTTPQISDSLELDNIVVTASKFQQTERETTKPAIIITRADIERSGGKDLPQLLNSQSGIRVNNSYATPSENSGLFMQGAAAAYTLILVDGLAITDPSGTGGTFDLRMIPLADIERIEIIKGSQSTLYGTDAIAGVINIITRNGSENLINSTGTLSYGSYNTFNGNVGVNGQAMEQVRYNFKYSRESSDGFSAAEDPSGDDNFEDDGFSRDAFYGKIDFRPMESLSISPFLNYSDYTGDYDADAFADADNEFGLKMFNPGIQLRFDQDQFRINGGYNFIRTERYFDSEFGLDEFEGILHNADVYATYQISETLQLLGGLNFQNTEMPDSENENIQAEVLSPYTTLYVSDINGFNAELGYRINNHTEYGNNSTFNFAPSYNVTDDVKLYASVGTGFKTPTLSELFGPFGANPDLEPQESRYINAGVETYLLDQTLKLGAQYFNREIDNIIIYAANGYENLDRQNDQGIELTADWIANQFISVNGHYNFLKGELTTEDASGSETTSDELIRRPTHSVGSSLSIRPTTEIMVKLEGEYNTERNDIFFDPVTFEQETVTLDPYTLVNFYGEYTLPNRQFTFFGDIRNLFNAEFTEIYGFNTTGFAASAGIRFNL
ncbi:MAG: TonB-dependent receptor [Balneolaceae bacterium]